VDNAVFKIIKSKKKLLFVGLCLDIVSQTTGLSVEKIKLF